MSAFVNYEKDINFHFSVLPIHHIEHSMDVEATLSWVCILYAIRAYINFDDPRERWLYVEWYFSIPLCLKKQMKYYEYENYSLYFWGKKITNV